VHRLVRTVTTILTGAAIAATLTTAPAVAAPPSAGPEQAARERIQQSMDSAVAAGTPGVLAVTRDDAGTWEATSGIGDLRTGRAPQPEGRFRIASVSKTFTATLVLQLAGEDRIDLDRPVQEYLPGLLPYPQPITVRQLLQHTSGMPRDLPLEQTWATLPEIDTERFEHFTPEGMVRASTTQPLLFEPGTGWSYSNAGFTVLALLVEKVSDRRIESVLRERILRPLRLHHTALLRDFRHLPRPAVRGYEQLYPAPAELTDVTTYNYSRYIGSGSMVSTAEDLNTFFRALLGGELLSPGLLEQMKQTVPATTPDGSYAGYDYGLGLMKLPLDWACAGAEPVWGHGGDLPGFGTWSMHTESTDRQITTVANQDMTRAPEAIAWHQLTVAAEFCDPAQAPATTLSTPVPHITPLATVALGR
jgi:D-alanyl-D-alanine carboxypeptidase